jgi:hypothetical protein
MHTVIQLETFSIGNTAVPLKLLLRLKSAFPLVCGEVRMEWWAIFSDSPGDACV